MKNKRLIALRTSLICVTALLIATVSALIIGLNKKEDNSDLYFNYSAEQYDANQVAIDTATAAIDTTNVSISLFTDAGLAPDGFNSSTNVITIKTAQELYKFSTMLNNNDSCLAYKYKLIANIDYSTMTQYFKPVGWKTNKPFSGEFDGAGYEINNLKYERVTTDEEVTSYNDGGMEYFAMFSKNTGTIKDLGLIKPEIAMSTATTITQSDGSTPAIISPLCGLNSGNISNVYSVNLDDPEEDEAGIAAAGGYIISGLIGKNTGTVNGAYVAYNIVSNYTVTDYIDFTEIVFENSGTLSNVYFYNRTIASYQIINNKCQIVYDSGLIGKTFMREAYYGQYCETLSELTSTIDALSGWYTTNDYPLEIQGAIDITTPIRRGITITAGTGDYADKFVAEINNVKDYTYMYELFNMNAKFSSKDMVYQIKADINLSAITPETYYFDGAISSTIEGIAISGSPILENGNNSNYPTIYNGTINNMVTTEGIECYGLFPYLTGTIKNLNVVSDVNFTEAATHNIKAIGLVAGYVDGGTIDNVNTKGNITFSSSIGKAYVGSLAGLLAGEATLSNVTASGTITNTTGTASIYSDVTGFIEGNTIGGVVGYSADTLSTLNTCYSKVTINAALGLAYDYAIGGILGAGYTKNCTELKNVGAITITGTNYSSLYTAGVIGRLLGISNQISKLDNYGDINATGSATATTYACGVVNADIIVTASGNKTPSKLKASGKTVFFASGLTNGANITISNKNSNLKLTNVINVNSGNGFTSKLSGLYNVNYKCEYDGNRVAISTNQSIDMYKYSSYAPVLNGINTSNTNYINIETVYNLRSINFTNSQTLPSATYTYTGIALGDYINYKDVKNEGNLSFELINGITATSNLNVSGIFDTLFDGYTASNIYNDGNITINEPSGSTANKNVNIYLSGVCRQNLSELSSNTQNPLSNDYDDTLVGTLDTVINNGDLTVSSYYLDKSTTINNTPATHPYFYSNIYVGGIAYKNKGIISNTFNLGDIDVSLYSNDVRNYEAGGIACIMDGQYAQIRDCANNGDITIIDTASSNKSIVNVAGIVAHNNDTASNINQVISFTINYGTITAFQASANTATNDLTPELVHSSAAGIMGKGVNNLVNVVNYGNSYASQCVAGIIAVIELGDFTNTTINVANSLNYGDSLAISPVYSNQGEPAYVKYDEVINYSHAGLGDKFNYYTFTGSVFSLFDFDNQTNVNIRYLINFNTSAAVIQQELNSSGNTIDTSTFITTRGGADTFGGNSITYAPLSTETGANIGVFSPSFVFNKAIDGQIDTNIITDKYISDYFQFVRFDKINSVLLDKIGWRTLAYANAAESLVKNVEALGVLANNANLSYSTYNLFESSTWLENADSTILSSYIEACLDEGELDSEFTSILRYVLFDAEANSAFSKSARISVVDTILDYYEKQAAENSTIVNYYQVLQTMLYDEALAKVIAEDTTAYLEVKDKIEEIIENSSSLTSVLDTYINALKSDSTLLNPLFVSSYYEDAKLELMDILLEGYDESTLEEIYNALTPNSSGDALKYKMYLQSHGALAKEIYTKLIEYNSFSTNSDYVTLINNSLSKYDFTSDTGIISTETLSTLTDNFPLISATTGWKYADSNSSLIGAKTTIQASFRAYKESLAFEGDKAAVGGSKLVLSNNPTKDYTELWNVIKNSTYVQNYISANYFDTYTSADARGNMTGLLAKATEYNNSYQSNDKPQSAYGIPEDNRQGISYGGDANKNDADPDEKNGYNYFGEQKLSDTISINTRFVYTPDDYVSYGTNYFGMFMSNGKHFGYGTSLETSSNYNIGKETNGITASSSTERRILPVYISVNADDLKSLLSQANVSIDSSQCYEFCWVDKQTTGSTNYMADICYKSISFISNSDGAKCYLYNNYNSGAYMYENYDFTPYSQSYTISYNYDSQTSNAGSLSGSKLVNTSGDKSTNSDHYKHFYVNSGAISGIWLMDSFFVNGTDKGATLFSKKQNETKNGNDICAEDYIYGVHTTNYIPYTISDLVALDGVRTKGTCNGIADEDEINIISCIITKMLESDSGKQAILMAIAEYSEDNNFTTSDSAILEMFTSAMKNTTYASGVVTDNIGDLLTYNYSSVQTIGNYLSSLGITLDSYKDMIKSYSANDLNNFKQLLLKTLDDYSKNCSNYVEYNTYTRNDLTEFMYNYLNYLYDDNPSISASDITAKLSAVSDNDLTGLTNLFNTSITLTKKKFEQIKFNDNYYTVNNCYIDTSSGNKIIGDNNSNITFTTPTFAGNNYELEVTYKGTINLNGSNSQTSNTSTTYTFTGLAKSTNYTINLNSDTEITDIKLYESEYTGDVRTDDASTTTPFASTTAATSTYNNNTCLRWVHATSQTNQTINITQPINAKSITSINVSFDTINTDNTNNRKGTIYLNGNQVQSNVGTTAISISNQSLATTATSFTLSAVSKSASNTKYIYIYNIKITYVYTLSNDTVVTQVQDVLTSSNNTYNISNSTGSIKYVNSSLDGDLTINNGANTGNKTGYTATFTLTPYSISTQTISRNTADKNLNITGVDMSDSTPILSNFNSNYYDNLSDVAKYVIKDTIIKQSSTNLTLNDKSYVIFKSNSNNGTISIGGNTITVDGSNSYYGLILNSGNYTYSSTTQVSEVYVVDYDNIVSVTTNGTTNIIKSINGAIENNLLEFDYSTISSFTAANAKLNDFNNEFNTSYDLFQLFYNIYPYSRTTNTAKTLAELRSNDIIQSIMTLLACIKQDSNNPTYYTIFADSTFTTDNLKEVIKLLGIADYNGTTSSLGKLLDGLNSSYYDDILISFTNDEIKKCIARKIWNIIKTNKDNNSYETLVDYTIGAYLGDDYVNNLSTLNSADLKAVLANYSSGNYQFILTDSTVDSDKVIALIEHLTSGSNINISGYGIYALSSSKGILNGAFIPDNIHLDGMKSAYDSTGLIDTAGAYWRGGSAANPNATDDITSVNYAILVEMKQLIKSISTTVFTLDLIESETVTHYSSTSAIDLDEHVITYYVPTGYVATNLAGKALTIDSDTKSIANLAKLTASSVSYANADTASELTQISVPAASSGTTTITNAFRVFAEDRTIFNDYDIVFKEVDFTFDLAYDTSNTNNITTAISAESATVSYKNGVVALAVTSTMLPENFDFTPYINIVDGSTVMEDAFSILNIDDNCVVDASHNATIVLEILKTLKAGTYNISISIFDSTPQTVTLIKSPSTECDMTECKYDGNDVTFTLNSGVYEATTYIDYGRAFNYNDLTDKTLETFYLNQLETSECATVDITAAKALNDDIMTYTVTYVITAESGASKTYKHYLVEKDPFYNYAGSTNYAFVTLYKDGSSMGTQTYDENVFYNADGSVQAIANAQSFATADTVYVRYGSGTAEDPYTYELIPAHTADDYNNIYVAFTRDENEPEFRVKYILNNFYTDGENVTYSLSSDTLANGATSVASYAGITASIGYDLLPGDYTFEYVYTSTGIWENSTEYTRTYIFPALVITKNASKDSLLKRITFLDSYTVLGNLSTVFNPNMSLRPGGPGDTHADFTLSANEENYFDYTTPTSSSGGSSYKKTPKVTVEQKTISYGNYADETDYFIVGAVSNAEIDNYAPTFAIDEYAEIYQYTTITKLTSYGAITGGQQLTDYEILTNHTQMLLYVPYTDGVETKSFLVELNKATNTWTNVYLDTYNGTGSAIATLTENKGSFTYDGKTYTVAPTCGAATYVEVDGEKVYNTSLYMDYIGTPETNHFWYVSYVVFAEDYLLNNNEDSIQYYHIALIDLTNNVLFQISVNAPEAIDMSAFYINLSFNTYASDDTKTTSQISCFATNPQESGSGILTYTLDNSLQILPNGYYYFYIDLPDGYVATCTFNKANQITGSDFEDENEGSYLPPSSIVTQKVSVVITITEGTGDDISTWGVSVSDIFTRQCQIAD